MLYPPPAKNTKHHHASPHTPHHHAPPPPHTTHHYTPLYTTAHHCTPPRARPPPLLAWLMCSRARAEIKGEWQGPHFTGTRSKSGLVHEQAVNEVNDRGRRVLLTQA